VTTHFVFLAALRKIATIQQNCSYWDNKRSKSWVC